MLNSYQLKREKSTDTKGHFITNANLLAEIRKCKANNNTLSNELAGMLLLMAEKYSFKGNWRFYPNREDMVSLAVLNLVQVWHKFDETKYNNPFAYYTTCITRCFLQGVYHEKEQSTIKKDLAAMEGVTYGWSEDRKPTLE